MLPTQLPASNKIATVIHSDASNSLMSRLPLLKFLMCRWGMSKEMAISNVRPEPRLAEVVLGKTCPPKVLSP